MACKNNGMNPKRKGEIDIKTLIELFDVCQLENIITGLHFCPETIIFLGYPESMTTKRMEDLNRFFASKLPEVRLRFQMLLSADFEKISAELRALVGELEDCVFDLTGGEELILAAMGTVAEECGIPMLQFDVEKGELLRVKNCEKIGAPKQAALSVKESILLNGGSIVEPEDEQNWLFDAEFKQDIEIMWEICRRDCRYWNRQSYALSSIANWCGKDMDLYISVRKKQLPMRGVFLPEQKFLEQLEAEGLIARLIYQDDFISFRYKNEQIQRCLLKSGNILEIYGYLLLQEIREEEPNFFDDARMGVSVDWDGLNHYDVMRTKDTRNEIDLILTRKMIPVFISCKNGEVHKEALYELETVAEHYGGAYARKVLFATYIDFNESARHYLLQRAQDMNILVLDGIHLMRKTDIKAKIRQMMK